MAMVVFFVLGAWARGDDAFFGSFDRELDCSVDPCSLVLPGAVDFQAVEGRPWVQGQGVGGEVLGWVVMSTDVVDIKGYSGKPLVTLIGLDTAGTIVGARVVHHSEPILLVGVPEEKLHDFVSAYVGVPADQKVFVGGGGEEGSMSVDIVSGATVTVLAENRTIMETARGLAEGVGVLEPARRVPGHFVTEGEPWTWREMIKRKALGHMVVTQEQMGGPADQSEPYIEIWFGIIDSPLVGKALLGERVWRRSMEDLKPGEHLVAIFGRGVGTFKGSSFVRGGIFDRVRLEQGLRHVVFRDLDYTNIGQPVVADAPRIKEGALFVARENRLDPGRPFDLVYLGVAFTYKGGIDREFRPFRKSHRTPKAIYVLDGPDPDSLVWRHAWKLQQEEVVFVLLYLFLVAGVFVARRWTAADVQRLERLHLGFMLVSFFVLGLYFTLQPSITQVLTVVGSVRAEWRWELFLSDPFLFTTWVFIVVTTLLWGRGVFCGWVCPYGVMTEGLFKLGRILKLPSFELPRSIHERLRHLRYVVLFALVGAFLYSPGLGEWLAEIEPFKSTFFIAPWTRPLGLFLYWLLLVGAALFYWRPFCRYLCPLGAALALPSTLRIFSPYRRDFCAKGCKICSRDCEPRAIRMDGSIDPRECLNCWKCEAIYHDDQRCPPLVRIRRAAEKARGDGTSAELRP